MPVRAVLRPLLALSSALDRPPPPGRSVGQRRVDASRGPLQMRIVTARGRWPVLARDHQVPVTTGSIMVRVYRPAAAGSSLPAHLYLHGGSFWLGSVEEYDPICRWYAGAVGCVVVSVDYRLAPEHPYPAAVEDAYAALGWVFDRAAELGVDPGRVSVGGFSAGGGLAAALAQLARDRSGPALVFQALECPITDLTADTASMRGFGVGYGLTRESLREAYGFYLTDPAEASEPYASPLITDRLTGLPPALVLTCECDPLRDEGEAYAERLRRAGVAVQQHRVPGHVHGSTFLTRVLPSARRAVAVTTEALRQAYGLTPA